MDLAEIAMSEPPSSTGAGEPSVPGSAKTPRLATMSGQPVSGSSMSPFTQPGAESMPTSPLQNGVCGFSSLPSLAAPEACSISVWTVSSPVDRLGGGQAALSTRRRP